MDRPRPLKSGHPGKYWSKDTGASCAVLVGRFPGIQYKRTGAQAVF